MAEPYSSLSSSSSNSSSSMKDKTFKGLGDLVRLLPTGTVFLFQFLNPVFTSNGHCHVINKVFTSILISLCGVSCFVSTFTDSYKDKDGKTRYGIATCKGIWPSSGSENLSPYKLRFGDFVHAFLSLIVFAIVSLMDTNTVKCFYPSFESNDKVLLMALPPIIGSIASVVFMLFPNTLSRDRLPCKRILTNFSVEDLILDLEALLKRCGNGISINAFYIFIFQRKIMYNCQRRE